LRLPQPQFIGCQHHILNLLLRHVMDELLGGKCTSPNMAYQFVSKLTRSYDKLKQNYKHNDVFLEVQHIQWRDDMQYLYEFGSSFRYYLQKGKFPYIKFKTLPSLSNARWNSRVILSILTFDFFSFIFQHDY